MVCVKTLRLLYSFKITCSLLVYLVSYFPSSFNPIKDKFQLLFQIITLF